MILVHSHRTAVVGLAIVIFFFFLRFESSKGRDWVLHVLKILVA